MKKDNLIWWVLGGVGALSIWYYYNNKKKVTTQDLIVDVIKEEENKYSTPFKAQYNIIMPADLVSKRVKEKADELTAGRYEIQPQRVEAPLYI